MGHGRDHLPIACDLHRAAGHKCRAPPKAGSSDDREAELAASLLALRLLLLAVLLAVLPALLHGLRHILVAFLLLDPALLVNEAVALGKQSMSWAAPTGEGRRGS